MKTYNPNNEALKKKYERYLSSIQRTSDVTNYQKIKDVYQFEQWFHFQNFDQYTQEQGMTYRDMRRERVETSNKSYATLRRHFKNLRDFLLWLSNEPGYKSKIKHNDIQVLSLTLKEENMADARIYKDFPTLEQLYILVESMPVETSIQKRNRAIVAFLICTGGRGSAILSLKIKHFDDKRRKVQQDGREVNTKFSKTILTQFFPVREDIQQITVDWIHYLKNELHFGINDPLFPATLHEFDPKTEEFIHDNLSKNHLTSTTTLRTIIKNASDQINIPYFSPHLYRDTISHLGMSLCDGPEDYKAWSQNMGHKGLLTTFTSYGEIHPHRQCEIIKKMTDKEEV